MTTAVGEQPAAARLAAVDSDGLLTRSSYTTHRDSTRWAGPAGGGSLWQWPATARPPGLAGLALRGKLRRNLGTLFQAPGCHPVSVGWL